ncbi:Methyltransferase domain-containing protein [Candidatus Nitrotoga sp. HW29]|uniref:class I SAM-dependent methyltransferase n=1 Tax=Candidatus Nitrotoga sp. HW29 TaxID=2886963 RepID=UPI001EF3B26B|nr:class I SAM-dependent methyltransferase [Candidatus Nitrotoga sp. HW29]CAH1904835.1 Methyltransferase domain-containing protein [Candidatus Nitrotoga sp. HW29]
MSTHSATLDIMAPTEAINFNDFLKMMRCSDEGFLQISPHRKYQHDEQSYDNQYQISPYDYVAGEGLLNLAKSLNLDINNPILELGCGTGRLSVGLLNAFDPAKVLVTDASSIFLGISRQKFLKNGLVLPHLGVLQFENISALPDDTFSLIVIRSALHHVDKYDEFLVTASKKLVRGGSLVFEEPLYEGLFVLGLIAKYLQKSASDKELLKDLKLLSDTMRFYCRTDVDKSLAEDKYVFRLNDILNAANKAELGLKFFPNRSFEDFAGEPSQFDYSKFAQDYLKYCMRFSDKTVTFFMSNASDVLEYIAEISGIDRAPESSGVFVLTRTI